MDFHEFWQENKRWILGVALGFLVYWIGTSIIGSVYSTSGVQRKISAARNALKGDDLYGRDALSAAEDEHEQLDSVRAELQAALGFALPAEFSLDGVDVPDLHLASVGRGVRRELLERTELLGIAVNGSNVTWATPTDRDEIQSVLAGIAVVQAVAARLSAAHEIVREADPDAIGVASIERLQVNAARRSTGRRPRRRPRAERGGIDLGQLLAEVAVRVEFTADEGAVKAFLEACRREAPSLVVGPDFKISAGRSAGDPLVVQGTLSGVQILEQS